MLILTGKRVLKDPALGPEAAGTAYRILSAEGRTLLYVSPSTYRELAGKTITDCEDAVDRLTIIDISSPPPTTPIGGI